MAEMTVMANAKVPTIIGMPVDPGDDTDANRAGSRAVMVVPMLGVARLVWCVPCGSWFVPPAMCSPHDFFSQYPRVLRAIGSHLLLHDSPRLSWFRPPVMGPVKCPAIATRSTA
jgi:hypothetical protein